MMITHALRIELSKISISLSLLTQPNNAIRSRHFWSICSEEFFRKHKKSKILLETKRLQSFVQSNYTILTERFLKLFFERIECKQKHAIYCRSIFTNLWSE